METKVWDNDDSELRNNHNVAYFPSIPMTYKEQEQTPDQHQYPDYITRNSNPTQVCVNCSKLLETGTETDAIFDIEVSEQFNLVSSNSAAATNAYENEFRETNSFKKKIKVKNILESVYKLHYLDLLIVHPVPVPETESESNNYQPLVGMQLEKISLASNFDNDGVPISLNDNICLCSPCSQVLTNLYKYYLLFNQLRQLNSFLAKKINRLDEKFATHSQRNQMPRKPTSSQPQETVDDVLSVIKCEVLMEKGGDESIFADAEHFDDGNYISQDEYTENEEFDFTVHTRENSMARVPVPDLMEANFGINTLSHVIVKNDPQDFHNDSTDPFQSSTPSLAVPGPGDYGTGNLKNSTNLMSGPWVRLKRLRNVQVGCPVLLPNLNQNPSTNFHEFDNDNLLGGKGRKTSKSINRVENIHLVFSEPSDNDDPSDSDFHIESESIRSKRKRNVTLPPKRKKIRNRNKISKLKRKNSCKTVSEEVDDGANLRDDTNDDAVDDLFPSCSFKSDDPKPNAKIAVINKSVSTKKKTAKTIKTSTKRSQIKLTSKSKLITRASPKASEISLAHKKEKRRESRRRSYKIDNYYRRRKVLVPNPCWHCELDFPTPEECYDHAKATHYKPGTGTGDFICSTCGRICPNKLSFTQHQHNICKNLCPGEKLVPYKCPHPHCGKGFPYKQYLDKHLPVHISERHFPCLKPGCDFKGKTIRLLNTHCARMHDEEREPASSVSSDGQVILSVVGEPIPYKCDHCEATFKTAHSRQLHAATFHTEDGYKKYREQQRVAHERRKEERKMKNARKSTICPECNVDFLTNLRLIFHRKTVHNVVQQFVCDQCGKNFSTVSYLRDHVRYAHTESRPFICEHCGKSYKTVYNLNDHVNRTHSEEGRRKYNELHRSQNQKRKLVAKALLSKTQKYTE